MKNRNVLMWFRQDLRLKDNPALFEAIKAGSVIPVYILDDVNSDTHKMGSASRVWLHYALNDLNASLGGKLGIYLGDAMKVILELVKNNYVDEVYWNRCYEPWRIKRDIKIKKDLMDFGVDVYSFNGSLLWEPWDIAKKDGTPYKVFTPYYQRGCLGYIPPREPIKLPSDFESQKSKHGLKLESLGLKPKLAWGEVIANHWDMTEKGGHQKLNNFFKAGISDYKEGRNYPSRKAISRLSPYLHFGQLSPQSVWYFVKENQLDDNSKTFLSELGWREFSYYLLYHFPKLPFKNWNIKFDKFSWQSNDTLLNAWQRGLTGYPIVDAGMRELWQTGFMHNRVRMIVASFLIKNCLIDWREGERWFWDCLLDADLASNSASWQWVAGCGADAAPYFRIFNPVTQGKKFDCDGVYTKKYIPELRNLTNKYLFNPWEAPPHVLSEAKVRLGLDYPHPIVELKGSRERALAAYQEIKGQ